MEKQHPKNLEKKWQGFWEKEGIYKLNPVGGSKSKKEMQGKQISNRVNLKKRGAIFSVDTPPPTVSGKMHLGHAFSYTQQDIIIRYHRMKGESIIFPFGTDDNGLPTERFVEKEKGVSALEMKREDFVKLCQQTLKEVKPAFIQNWKDIGMSCDFNLSYSTIDQNCQKISQRFFIDLYKMGRIYRKKAPILWCPQCQTAVAQAELADKMIDSVFYDISFSLKDSKKQITISTTRPELLPSCVAIFVHPQDKRYKNLIGKKVIVPIFGQMVSIKEDEKVDMEKGSGIVMCCTFGDVTDMEWYFTHHLPLIISISKDGKMSKTTGKFQGLTINQARVKIVDELKKEKRILAEKKIKHLVNTHERCNRAIEILPTWQWFIKILDKKEELLELGKKMNWYPEYMRYRYEHWIKNLKWDWCVSRQRFFGIPIPIWYCKKCKKVKLAKIKDLPVNPLGAQPKEKCSCGSAEFLPEKDVLDTWATSSLTPQIVESLIASRAIKKNFLPMSLRPQAHDIISTWLFYTVTRSYFHFGKIPWKDIMISGFVLDPKGEKMSKSKGNIIEPNKIIEKYGADSLRYWASGVSLGKNLRYQEKEIKNGHRTVTKIWNASRFTISHLKNFDIKNWSNKNKLYSLDQFLLSKLQKTIQKCEDSFKKYEFSSARKKTETFFWNDFCDNYLELVKWRVYSLKENDWRKKSAQFTLYYTLLTILKLFAPVLPFITEEIYQLYFRKKERQKSIHQTTFPKIDQKLIKEKRKFQGEKLMEILAEIRKEKSSKNLSQKAEIKKLTIYSKNKELLEIISLFGEDLKQTANIKEICFKQGYKKDNKFLF